MLETNTAKGPNFLRISFSSMKKSPLQLVNQLLSAKFSMFVYKKYPPMFLYNRMQTL